MDLHMLRSFRDVRTHLLGVPMAAALAVVTVLPAAGTAEEPSQWSLIKPLASRSLMLDVAIADTGRLVAVGERGHVLVSDDQGSTWTQVSVPTRSMLTGVCLVGNDNGWAVGHDAVILRTKDGGDSWEQVYWAPEDEAPLFDVWFSNPREGFALGAYGSWFVTEDGGSNWIFEAISDDDSHLHKVSEAEDGRLFLAAERGMLYRSDDGGVSWLELPSPYEGSFFGILPVSADEVLAFGLRGHLFRSEDAGQSWIAVETATTAMLTDGIALDDGTVLVVGLGGTVLVSTDRGRSFDLTTSGDRQGINAIVESAPGQLTMVGEFGVRTLPAAQLLEHGGSAEGTGAR